MTEVYKHVIGLSNDFKKAMHLPSQIRPVTNVNCILFEARSQNARLQGDLFS